MSREAISAVADRVIHHAKGLFIKLSGGEAMAEKICWMRERITKLAHAPPSLSGMRLWDILKIGKWKSLGTELPDRLSLKSVKMNHFGAKGPRAGEA